MRIKTYLWIFCIFFSMILTIATAQDSQPAPVVAVGVIVRFKSPEIQALAQDNLPPPPEMVAELEAALGEKLVFERATVNEAYVFSFLVPKEGENTIADFLQPAKTLPSIDWIEADKLMKLKSSSVQTQSSMMYAQSFSSDPYFSDQWNMMDSSGGIDAAHAWDITHGSSSTVVAVVDSGVFSHPEFADRLLGNYDFTSRSSTSNGPDCIDPHGTGVTGIIAASGDNGIGIAGVNWRTRILSVRVMDCNGVGQSSITAEGIQWAAGIRVPGVLANPYPAKVINLSLGSDSREQCLSYTQRAISAASAVGALVVVAAGNSTDNVQDYSPNDCRDTLSVIATDINGELAPYSNFTDPSNKNGAIAAPGGDKGNGILSTSIVPDANGKSVYGYEYITGTSIATPHVSGIAALMLGVNPNLSQEQLLLYLKATSRSFPTTSSYCIAGFCGVGIADAYRAVMASFYTKSYQFVYEFHNTGTNHYMLTASNDQATALYNGGTGVENWEGTLKYFYAWSGPQEGAVPVYRFYTLGANSHFYTASTEDRDLLIKLNPTNIYSEDQWTYEGIAFYAKLPTSGLCPTGSVSIYRVYNNRAAYNDSNHRFVSSFKAYMNMISKGWVGENIVFCVAADDN